MSAKLYPFIDIAVHEQVRGHFARGDAAVLFSADMGQVLWSNGEGAALFGTPSIYDFIDSGANTGDVAFRQMEATARQLQRVGDNRTFLMRIGSGFRRMPVHALVEMISVHPGETAILFTAPGTLKARTPAEIARTMISGFDDPDTHMAVLDGEGHIIAASSGFESLAMTPQTCRALVTAVARDSDWLVKRPVPTGKGHLPAAIGKLSDSPALHLLFAVETILGNMDPGADFDDEAPAEEAAASDLATPLAIAETLDAVPDASEVADIPADIEETPSVEDETLTPVSDEPAISETTTEPEIDIAVEDAVADDTASDTEAEIQGDQPETDETATPETASGVEAEIEAVDELEQPQTDDTTPTAVNSGAEDTSGVDEPAGDVPAADEDEAVTADTEIAAPLDRRDGQRSVPAPWYGRGRSGSDRRTGRDADGGRTCQRRRHDCVNGD